MNTNNEDTTLTLKFASEDGKDCFLPFLHEIATIHLETIKSLPPAEADKECDMFPEPINGWLKVEAIYEDLDDEDTEDEEA